LRRNLLGDIFYGVNRHAFGSAWERAAVLWLVRELLRLGYVHGDGISGALSYGRILAIDRQLVCDTAIPVQG